MGAVAYQAVARDREYQRLLARGDAALTEEQTFGAIEAYSGAVALRPDSMLARLRRGETYQRRGDLDAAARDFRAAAALDPAAPRPYEELGNVLYQMQRYGRAAEAYESALTLDDRSARVSYKLALARYRANDLEAAVAGATRTVRLSDSTADAYYLLGLCLRDLRRTADAQRAFEQAVAMSPGFIPAREELADLYAAQNRHADELDQLQVIAGLDHDHVERQIAVGLAQARAGHAEPAVIALGTALERAPGEPLVYQALGRVWLQDAEARNDRLALNKALEALERVGTGPASTSEALTLFGRALLRDDQLDRAEQTLQQATDRYPLDPSAFFYYAAGAVTLADVYAPLAQTDPATGVTTTAATLNGQVNPNNDATDAHFEYGTTTGYGQTTPPQALVLDVDPVSLLTNDYRLHQVQAPVSGLTCATTYHYRVVAVNPEGTTLGADQLFTTSDCPGMSRVQFAAASYSVSEAGGQATIALTRTGDLTGSLTVAYSTTDGSARHPQDYQGTSGAVVFGPRAKLGTFKVPIVDRTTQEGPRTVLLFLSDPQPVGATLGTQRTAVLTILDTDQGGKIQFSPSTYSIDASSGPKTVKLSVKRTAGLASGVTVHCTMTNGTATGGTDYDATPRDLAFDGSGLGATIQTLDISVAQNVATAKTFTVTLSAPTGGAVLGTPITAKVTIFGTEPTLAFSAGEYTVKTTTPMALITVKRSAPLAGTVVVGYSTQPGSATNGGVDYQDVQGTLTFGPNVTTRTFGVPITRDPLVDVPKTVLLDLGSPTWTLGTAAVDAALGSSTLTIQDLNLAPKVQFTAASYSVKEGSPKAAITVKRTGDLAGTLTVPYSATGGTATNAFPANAANGDYLLQPGVLAFGPGVSLRTLHDRDRERRSRRGHRDGRPHSGDPHVERRDRRRRSAGRRRAEPHGRRTHRPVRRRELRCERKGQERDGPGATNGERGGLGDSDVPDRGGNGRTRHRERRRLCSRGSDDSELRCG